jgi:hypothetical protein
VGALRDTAGIIGQLGAAQFAKLELLRSVRELVTLFGARANPADYDIGAACVAIQSGRCNRCTACGSRERRDRRRTVQSSGTRSAATCRRGASRPFFFLTWTPNRLAEQVHFGEIDDFVTAPAEHGLQHENAKTFGLLEGDRWRHRKLLT